MSDLVASSFQHFVTSSAGKNSLISDDCLHPSPHSCHRNMLEETLPNVDPNLYSPRSSMSFDISHNTPLFDLGFVDTRSCLDLSQTGNVMCPIDFRHGYQQRTVRTTFSPQSDHNTARARHLKSVPDSSCKRASRGSKSRGTHDSNRIRCSFYNCLSTFARRGDLIRHHKSLHCPKTPCIHSSMGCSYQTGRLDKMREHTRKKHPTIPHFDRVDITNYQVAKTERLLHSEISHLPESEVEWVPETCDLSAFVLKDINLGAESMGMEFPIQICDEL
ncbi:hypothetical protein BCON_0199g00190 [Botryotinia convoluta]|uniref:C2H2-type domain-containing protein n=1 Tax=Botryotinia convoluta TaxID=54673 RepID=A0A4Z1HYI3_9HELO|nr:hypothetical protein BCON_0199g00190 [Botryotinia convoluta]